jgi:hypothetical protein
MQSVSEAISASVDFLGYLSAYILTHLTAIISVCQLVQAVRLPKPH